MDCGTGAPALAALTLTELPAFVPSCHRDEPRATARGLQPGSSMLLLILLVLDNCRAGTDTFPCSICHRPARFSHALTPPLSGSSAIAGAGEQRNGVASMRMLSSFLGEPRQYAFLRRLDLALNNSATFRKSALEQRLCRRHMTT